MIVSSPPAFPQLVQDYFCQHLINRKNASPETIAAYRDAMRLLLTFVRQYLGQEPSQLAISDLNTDTLERFLNWLEEKRGNSVRTRNNRFAAMRSFLRYAAARDPALLSLPRQSGVHR